MEMIQTLKKWARDHADRIRSDKVLSSRIYLISFATALLILAVAVRGPEQKGRIISDGRGHASAIERYSVDTGERYDFEVEIMDAEGSLTKEVSLNLQAAQKGNDSYLLSEEVSKEATLDTALDSVINEIEYSGSKTITLPTQLKDGTEISWKQLDKKDYSVLILIPFVYIALLIFVIRYSGSKDSEIEAVHRRSILRSLPRFCNQLFLMMNAGMILSDAFGYITESYASMISNEDAASESEYFERELASIRERESGIMRSTASIINEFAIKNDVKEMIRIATILTENEKRGSDVIESLSRESRYLWDERKIVARESGKMIDTKMSYPLGILLILLIVITMSPAMLSM